MAKQNINIGSYPDDPSADKIKDALEKAKGNFDELYVKDGELEDQISVIQTGQDSGVIGYADKATMDADNSQSAQTLALVTNDATASNNGWYRYDGSAWVATDFTENITNINAALTEEGETF